ncbi:MAG: succinylglutamate desuccinylase/aspartoacylase family protein, partial [Longimicrobiales bacterium]|nr:succinylglutamate desuccinylase/aspartoacylase family protein [Longimicrobiales bacterium]
MLRTGEGVRRVLGDFGSEDGAATLVVVAGLHGNEPAGVLAAQRVARTLAEGARTLQGRLLLLAGNLPALRKGVRYLDRDLNRAWTEARVRALRNGQGAGASAAAEDGEQRELLRILEGVVRGARAPVCILDLHTTSGAGAAFTTVADTLPNRALALRLPVPVVLGLE